MDGCTVKHLIETLQQFVKEGVSEEAQVRIVTLDNEHDISLIEARPNGREVHLHTDEQE
jgi:hypothetical protein